MNLPDDFTFDWIPGGPGDKCTLSLADTWILTRLDEVVREYTGYMENYDFGMASSILYSFIWDEFCDWYLEAVKPDLYADNEGIKSRTRHILHLCLTTVLKLYNPVIPFVTEEIYRELPGVNKGSLTVQKWPEPLGLDVDGETAKARFTLLTKLIKATRNLKKEIGLPDSHEVGITIRPSGDVKALIEGQRTIFDFLAKVSAISYIGATDPRPRGALFNLVEGTEIYLAIEDKEALKSELERLKKKVRDKESYITGLDKKLGNEGFIDKAPHDVVEAERGKLMAANTELDELRNRYDRMSEVLR
jgi:valyl-tRNA synthetase